MKKADNYSNDIIKKVWAEVKPKAWYFLLLFASTIYVIKYRFEIYDLKEINAQNLIFLLWLLLLAYPLISEMEFLGIKIKKEVEKATEGLNENIHTIQTQLSNIQLSSSLEANINVGNNTLPSEQKLEELLKLVKNLQMSSTQPFEKPEKPMVDQGIYLFTVRRDMEIALRELCEKAGLTDNFNMTIPRMTQVITKAELISITTHDLIREVNRIANRGVHGEIVSDKYINFVYETFPEIMRQLKEISSQLKPIVCNRCHFTGMTMRENVCPQCGWYNDD